MIDIIIQLGGFALTFWLLLSHCIDTCTLRELDYKDAKQVHQTNFGLTYLLLYKKARVRYLGAFVRMILAGLGFLFFLLLFVYILITYLVTL